MSKKNNYENKKGWWYDRYDYDYRDYSYTKESGSRGWMKKLGGGYNDYDYSDYGCGLYGSLEDNPNEVYQKLLNQLQNSANIIGDQDKGNIRVKWSDGSSTNSPSEKTVFLSPDNLTNKTGKVEDEAVDAMTGKVYLASALRDTVEQTAYATAQVARGKAEKSPIHRGAVAIWEAIETSIARHKVIEDWSGFSPYICKDSEHSSASQKDVQKFIDASVENPTIDSAVLGISWNLLNPNSRVVIPECYNQCIDAAAAALSEEIQSKDRFRIAYSLASKIASLLPVPPEEEKQGSGKEDGGEGVDGCDCEACRQSRKEREEKKTKSKRNDKLVPKVLDSSLLGEKVENSTDESLANQNAESGDPDDNDKSVKIGYDDDSVDATEPTFIVMRDRDNDGFNSMIRKYSSAVRAIRNSLSFRNNSMKIPSYGHRSGEIDENSLFKIKMDDDRLMLRTEVISEKSIAVCLLVDESGSMSGSRIRQARDVAATLATALNGVSGIVTSVYGHTAEEGNEKNVTIREYLTPRNPHLSSCMEMRGRCENHDGFAIQHTANAFFRDYGAYDRKIMFVISDGSPAGSNYGGGRARRHIKKVADACRSKLGVEVYGVGIDEAYENSAGNEMYGQGNFVVLEDVTSSLPIMARFIRQVAMSMKK